MRTPKYEKAPTRALTRKCGHCGELFGPVNDDHRFCSPQCRLQGWVVKKAAELAGQNDLFAEPSDNNEALDIGLAARDSAAHRADGQLADLVPLARELAAGAGEHGITISDVRLAAERRGLALPKNLSSLGALFGKAGLTKTDRMRRSTIPVTHGNLQRVWVDGR